MAVYHAPEEWTEWTEWLAAAIDGRSRWRLPLVMLGMLFAGGRRTVTTWLRAAMLQGDYRAHYHFLQTVGHPGPARTLRHPGGLGKVAPWVYSV